jgi:hypothetical protein
MLLLTHTALGIFLAENINNPLVGGLTALLSHYVSDIIPHEPSQELFYVPVDKNKRDPILNKKVKRRVFISLFDTLGSLLLIVLYLIKINPIPTSAILSKLFVIFLSLLPDILTVAAVYFQIKILHLHQLYHYKIHTLLQFKLNYITAYGYQLIVSLLIFTIALKYF